MNRIPEPELMDDPEQALAYAEADFSEPNELFLECFRELHPEPLEAARVLDLGCGPADILLRFARVYPKARLLGLDGSEAMLELGRRALQREPELAGRVALSCERLPSERLPRAAYDAVISNSLLHHLREPQVLWDTVRQCGRRGAAVVIMDLHRPASAQEVDRLVETYAADAPAVLRRDFRNSLFAAFSVEEVGAQLREASLGQLRVELVSDRHLCVRGHLA